MLYVRDHGGPLERVVDLRTTSTTRANEHGKKANGKGIRGVNDRRTQRGDGEVILDEYHQAKSMLGHQQESTHTSDRSGRAEGFHIKQKPGSGRDSIGGSWDLDTCMFVLYHRGGRYLVTSCNQIIYA